MCFSGVRSGRCKMSLVASRGSGSGGGGGGGRKRPRCKGSRAEGCDCPDCKGWVLGEIEKFTKRRIERRKRTEAAEKAWREAALSRKADEKVKVQCAVRRQVGYHPDIFPLFHPNPGRHFGPSPLDSRWVVRGGEPRGSWKTLLDIDRWNIGYINRLYHDWDQPQMLGDVLDGFCRGRHRVGEVLEILSGACIFLRLVGNRNNPRDLMTTRQLDAAWGMEHPEPLEQGATLGVEAEENRLCDLGAPCREDPGPDEVDADLIEKEEDDG